MQLGVIGLGTMGANLARNALRNGAKVGVFNRTQARTDEFLATYKNEGAFIGHATIKELVDSLKPPRAILLMVKSGDAIDTLIAELASILSSGDTIIDAGNSHYRDTERRMQLLEKNTIHFIGMGVSGGEEGALRGPSMMPGGDEATYAALRPLFEKMAADDGAGGKCVAYMGPGGAGHFVKMVHNGIEYGMMQIIAEVYQVLKEVGGVTNEELAAFFHEMNATPYLKSFLIEITANVFEKKDDDQYLVDLILDKAGQKGTGKWTTNAALDLGVATPIMTEAVNARIISGMKDFRVVRAKEAPESLLDTTIPKKEEFFALSKAVLEFGFCSAYAEGFLLLSVASKEYTWNLNLAEIARIWRGGCIIRSGIVEKFQAMFSGDAKARNELRNFFNGTTQTMSRSFITLAIARGIPIPSLSACVMSYDAYRSARLPQNLIQAQRDFFGAHTFERTDKSGTFHAKWGE